VALKVLWNNWSYCVGLLHNLLLFVYRISFPVEISPYLTLSYMLNYWDTSKVILPAVIIWHSFRFRPSSGVAKTGDDFVICKHYFAHFHPSTFGAIHHLVVGFSHSRMIVTSPFSVCHTSILCPGLSGFSLLFPHTDVLKFTFIRFISSPQVSNKNTVYPFHFLQFHFDSPFFLPLTSSYSIPLLRSLICCERNFHIVLVFIEHWKGVWKSTGIHESLAASAPAIHNSSSISCQLNGIFVLPSLCLGSTSSRRRSLSLYSPNQSVNFFPDASNICSI